MRVFMTLALSLPLIAQPPAPRDLRVFYQENCVRCHGLDGSGRDASGNRLKGLDFTDPAWAGRTQDAALVKAILNGKFFGLAMPAFKGKLSPEEAQALVTQVVRKAEKGRDIEPERIP